MDEFNNQTPIASVDDYVKALKTVRDKWGRDPSFNGSDELKMVQAQYHAPQHTITAPQLAEHLGYTSYGVANLRYGKFAHLVANALKHEPGPFADGAPHWWRALSYGNDNAPITDEGHYEWVMRPELCQALERMGWLGPPRER